MKKFAVSLVYSKLEYFLNFSLKQEKSPHQIGCDIKKATAKRQMKALSYFSIEILFLTSMSCCCQWRLRKS